MIWAPVSIAMFTAEAVGILLLAAAAKTAAAVLLEWDPARADKKRLKLEIDFEVASIRVRAATWALFFSTLVFVVAICNVYPSTVPGAMCGTGVMQAAGDKGGRALFFNCAAVLVLLIGGEIEKIDRTRPDSPLAKNLARILLLSFPLALIAFHATFRAVSAMDVQQPVDCCAVVYDLARPVSGGSVFDRTPDSLWVAACLAGGATLLVWGGWLWGSKKPPGGKAVLLLAIFCAAWALEASVTLVRVFSAYYYQVLNHHCPWCMFSSEHDFVGYPLFGALAFAVFESLTAAAAAFAGKAVPALREAAAARTGKAGARVCFAVLAFLLLSGAPAVVWRLKHGVWIGG